MEATGDATGHAGALRRAIVAGDRGAVLAMLDDDPSVAAATEAGEVSPLLTAYYHGRPRLAADLEIALEQADIPLDVLEAAAAGDQQRLAEVVEADADAVHERTVDGFTPLHLAAFLGRAGATMFLAQLGADVHAVADNPSRVQPLHSGVASGDVAVVEALVRSGADVDACQAGGLTPLMGAAAQGASAVVERLLAAGARRRLCDDEGRSAADHAAATGHDGLADLLTT